jgi:toxin HigB-1
VAQRPSLTILEDFISRLHSQGGATNSSKRAPSCGAYSPALTARGLRFRLRNYTFHYISVQMILSYHDKLTEAFSRGEFVKEFQGFTQQANKRLKILGAAKTLKDLENLRSNYLKNQSGERAGQLSIRINEQWRICFVWPRGDNGPSRVEICDTH